MKCFINKSGEIYTSCAKSDNLIKEVHHVRILELYEQTIHIAGE